MAERATAIIPARMGSTRFPGKALAAETGRPLVVHVCERAAAAGSVGRVVVATDDARIASAVRAAGFETIMTGEHPNGTSRLAEAAGVLGLGDAAVVLNVQGDEPEIEPGVIDAAAGALAASSGWASAATVAGPFAAGEDPADPNIVKAVAATAGPDAAGPRRALYFSRALVPFARPGAAPVAPLKHVGLYAYTAAALRAFVGLAPTPLEAAEGLEQLRWLEHGLGVAVAVRTAAHHGIDTPEQYAGFVARWRAGGGVAAPGGL